MMHSNQDTFYIPIRTEALLRPNFMPSTGAYSPVTQRRREVYYCGREQAAFRGS
jgi:hypothetical protein